MKNALLLTLTTAALSTPAQAQYTGYVDGFEGQRVPSVALRSQDDQSQSFAVRAKKIYAGHPSGFYRMWLQDVETVFHNIIETDDFEVIYVSQCLNYDRQPYSAYVSCGVQYDPLHVRGVAKLTQENCSSSERDFHTQHHFFNYDNWYLSGRTGYYQGQSCTAEIAVKKNGQWLKDFGGKHNFQINFDRTYTAESDMLVSLIGDNSED